MIETKQLSDEGVVGLEGCWWWRELGVRAEVSKQPSTLSAQSFASAHPVRIFIVITVIVNMDYQVFIITNYLIIA